MFLDERQRNYIIELMRGTAKKPPVLARLSEWAMDKYGLKIYGYFFDIIRNDALPRLRIVLWDKAVQESLRTEFDHSFDREIQRSFREKFLSIAKEEGILPPYRNLDRTFVFFETIEDELQKIILREAKPELETLVTGDIKKLFIAFENVHIFFETDEQLLRHKTDGTNEAIKQQCTEIAQKYDEFGAFKNGVICCFSSIQTLNEQFGGSIQHYLN